MASAPRVGSVVINTGNPDRLAAFWTELLGVGIARRSGPYFIWLEPQHQGGISVAFQKVEEPTEGRRRLHLDMTVEDLDSSVQRGLDLGASHVEEHTSGDFRWVVPAARRRNTGGVSPALDAPAGVQNARRSSRLRLRFSPCRMTPMTRRHPRPISATDHLPTRTATSSALPPATEHPASADGQ